MLTAATSHSIDSIRSAPRTFRVCTSNIETVQSFEVRKQKKLARCTIWHADFDHYVTCHSRNALSPAAPKILMKCPPEQATNRGDHTSLSSQYRKSI